MELIGFGIATLGPALAIGWIFSSLIQSAARQPEAANMLRGYAILGFAVAEALAILAFVLFIVGLFL